MLKLSKDELYNDLSQIIAKLRSVSNWQRLSEQDIGWLVNNSQIQEAIAGKVLIKEGEPVKNLYIVIDGIVSLSVASTEESNQEIAQLSGGEIVGEMSFIDHRPAHLTATTQANSQLLVISQQQLTAKLKQDQGFACRFYQAIALLLSNRLKGISALLVRSQVVPGQPLRKVLLVFSELLDSDIDWMSTEGVGERVTAKTVLLEQGQPASALYILLEGSMAVSVTIGQGKQQINKEIAKLSTGEIVGEMSFLDDSNASATVKASEASLVLTMPKKNLAAKLQKDLKFASRFYRAIAIVLLDRLRDRLSQHGYSKLTYDEAQPLSDELEYEDELDIDILDNVSLAGVRFDWLVKRLRNK